MATLNRLRVALTGFPGGPGVSTFYFSSGVLAPAHLHTFYQSLVSHIPVDVHIAIANTGDIIEDTTGDIVGDWAEPAAAFLVGESSVGYAAPVGASIRWLTGGVVNGHRVRGRTFIVPLANDNFGTDGALGPVPAAAFQVAGAALIAAAAGDLMVWSRPALASTAGPARAGSSHAVTAATVTTMAAVLRSRRD